MRIGVGSELDECRISATISGIAEDPSGHGPNVRFRIGTEGDKTFEDFDFGLGSSCLSRGASNLARTPQTVQTALDCFTRESGLEKRFVFIARGEFELSTEADSVVGVGQQSGEISDCSMGKALSEEGSSFGDES